MGDIGSDGYTLDEALVAIGFGKFQVYVVGYAGLASISLAMQAMIVSFIGQSVKVEWNLSSTDESILTSVIFAGYLVGAYSTGFISDSYGRRKGILGVAIMTSGAGFLTALAPNYISMVILRCLVGVGLGGLTVYLSWFLEFVPAPNRGAWAVCCSTFWAVGTIFEASLAWMILPRFGWRWLLALSSIPAFVILLLYNLVPESPGYLCMKGQTADAQNLLKRAATINQTQLPHGILISDQMAVFDDEEANSSSLADPLLLSPKKASKTGFSKLRMLFSPSLYKTTLLLWVLYFGTNFAYYGIVLLTSELTSEQSDCNNSVTLHPGNPQDSSYRDILVASFAELPGMVFPAFIVDRFGRKLSMGIMLITGCIFLLPLSLPEKNEISTTISLFGARMCITGASVISIVYALEVYPTSVRATGSALADVIGGLGAMICPFLAVGLLQACYQTTAIILLEFVIIVSGLCVFLFPFETKGLALQENVVESEN